MKNKCWNENAYCRLFIFQQTKLWEFPSSHWFGSIITIAVRILSNTNGIDAIKDWNEGITMSGCNISYGRETHLAAEITLFSPLRW